MTDPQPANTPERRPDDPDLEHARPERDLAEDADIDPTVSDAQAADTAEADADAAEAADDTYSDDEPATGGRPRLIVMIGAALLLVAIGAGLAVAFAPNPAAPVAGPASSTAGAAAPAGTANPAADLPTPSVPTALPLSQAIGDVSSTEPVAQVGDTTITRGEFVRAYQPGAPASEVLNQLIQVELVVQAAAEEGVTVDESEVDAEISTIKLQNGISDDAAFSTFLQQNNIDSEEELRSLIARSKLIDAMLLAHTTMEQARARHILLAATGEEVEARKAEAEALLAQLEEGADFAQLAAEKSEDPGSKDNGGDLGWAPRGAFVPEFDEAIFSMEQDELRLVQSQFGWHIIQLLDTPEVRSPDSPAMLNTPAGQQAFNDTFLPWLDQLQKDAEAAEKIEILVSDDELVAQP